ncbi:MAG: DUF3267 domain-containing protein [Eubacteriales bacterium]|nr:DUF3267 domain-containing protein [Eubacteriales bacterium]
MRFHNAGKYDGDESKLPQREHEKNTVPFREPSLKQLAVIANIGAFLTIALCCVPVFMRGAGTISSKANALSIGAILSLVTLVPHEFLHGLCFREDVYMYSNLKQGMMFVVGTEDMSRGRFVFMSLLPNCVFGLLPYVVFLLFPRLTVLGMMGAFCIGMGFGDYINVFNALTQMPKGAKTYLSGTHSYWYMPESAE